MTEQTEQRDFSRAKNGEKLTITYVKRDELIPYEHNSKKHSPEQVRQIVESIKQFGWTVPILIEHRDGKKGIIAGEGRWLAAGPEYLDIEEVPTIDGTGFTEEEKRAYVIADNKLTENSEWDEEMLVAEIQALKDAEFNVDLTGFSSDEIDKLFEDEPEPPTPDPSPQLEGLIYKVIVECQGEAHQAELLERFEKEGLKCQPLIS